MVNFDQGPGRNIEFCLITTGINIDPDHGCFNREIYQWLKNVILQRAEIHFENQVIREEFDENVSSFLEGYDSTPRTAYQLLLGLVEHSNAWTDETLTDALDTIPFPRSLDPQDGEYSIDFVQSMKDGMTLFRNQFIGSDVWVEHQTFYYSSCKPVMLDGVSGDIWLVSDGQDVELWYKPAFKWVRLADFVTTTTPPGTLTHSKTDPGNSTNSWWLDLTGINIRKYSKQLNIWEPFTTAVTVSESQPIGLSDGDLWLRILGGKFSLFVFDATINAFNDAVLSKFAVQDRDTNSAFVGTFGDNNFLIQCGQEALEGGPLAGENNLKILKNGTLIQTMVDSINFIGPDLEVTTPGTGEVDVEHLPITSLPEQTSAPSLTSETGKVFTLDVSGTTELFYLDNTGDLIQLTNQGNTIQNVFIAVSTASAVSGQTIFSLPSSANAVLAVKVNGVDTIHWTFTSPSVTYLPIPASYTIQTGDVVTVLYYGQ